MEELIPMVFFGTMSWLIYASIKNKHVERMFMLENSIPGDYFGVRQPYKYNFWVLRISVLLIGASLGYLIGLQSSQLMLNDDGVFFKREEYISAVVFLSVGIAWLIEFFVEKRLIDKTQNTNQ